MKKQNLTRIVPTALAVAIASTAASQAFAEETDKFKFGLYLRSDLVMNDSDADGENNTGDSTRFQTTSVRVNFMGQLNDKTSYRIRWRPNTSTDSADNGKADGSSPSLKYAYLDRKISDTFKVRAGKHFAPASGGREGDYSGLDVYHYSVVGNQVLAYETGVSAMFDVAGQSLSVSIFNGDAEANQDTSGLTFGFGYYGDFANGMVQPIVSYYSKNSTEQVDDTTGDTLANGESATDTFLSAGVRVNFGPAHVEADYLASTIGSHVDGGDDTESTSIVLKAGASLMDGKFRPHAKVESSEVKDFGEETAYTLALEYYPEPEWRVHAAYVSDVESFDAANTDDEKESKIILGFSFAFTDGQ